MKSQKYVGIKGLVALPMSRGEYNTYRGWATPANENPADDGYIVEYVDGGAPNDPRHTGYISWSPKDVFENSYSKSGALSFSEALWLMQRGERLSRAGWNGKDQWVQMVDGGLADLKNDPTPYEVRPHIALKTVQNSLIFGWVPSSGDMFAKDWRIV